MTPTIRLIGSAFVVVAAATTPAPTLAQARPALSPNVERFVAVNAPIVALTHVRVVDGRGTPARDDQTIIVRGDRIDAVGPAASTPVPAGARVLDLNGHTVIPGLVGLHEHTWFGGMRVSTQMSASGPLLYLAMGVTTAMTAGTMFAYQERNLQRAVDARSIPGPRFLIAGPYLSEGNPAPGSGARLVTSPE
jgi:imidazolonepropionase-like amidohydrolase